MRYELCALCSALSSRFSATITPPRGNVLLVGETVSHYKVLDKLGHGGMGVVYRAKDTRLERYVALKFLPDDVAHDPQALERFQREAKSASALNHPNICTIYDIGESDGREFIAMEMLEGQTLQERISHRPLPLDELLELAIQIADGLAAAHAKGIVHRDLKPSNIFVTESGHAKILDFGLASKTMKRKAGAALSAMATGSLSEEHLTSPGTALGTVAYMSPEQARGEDLDERTDLFSLGAVLYEMATGRAPFIGQTSAVIFDGILRQDPVPPSRLNVAVTPELEHVIGKALEKDRDIRYQSAAELRADLRRARRDSSSGRVQLPPAPKKSRGPWIVLGLVALAAAVVAPLLWIRPKKSAPAPNQSEWVQITDFTDSAVSPALSPDGRMLAFIRGDDTFFGPGQVYVKMLPDGDPVQLTHDERNKMSPQFSPDGSRIAYTTATEFDTWVVPVLGGEPRRMLPNASGLTWTDPGHILFSEIQSGLHMLLVTADQNRTGTRDVYVPPQERGMAHRSALSPDGKWVLVVSMDNAGWLPCRLVPFDGGSLGRVAGPKGACTHAAWSPDGNWMYFSAAVHGVFHLWRQRYPDGPPEQISSGVTEEEGIAIAPDGKSLITSVGTAESSIWLSNGRSERQVSSVGYGDAPRFSADGKTLYYLTRTSQAATSIRTGEGELWASNVASGRSERPFPGINMLSYDFSPDGKTIAFSAADKDGSARIWLAPLDRRRAPRRLDSETAPEDSALFLPNGDLLFRRIEGPRNFLYRARADGSDAHKVMPEPLLFLTAVSPDGSLAAIVVPTDDPELPVRAAAYPLAGGQPATLCTDGCDVDWSRDGKNLLVKAFGMGNPSTAVVPIPPGKQLPPLPPNGVRARDGIAKIRGTKIIPNSVEFAPDGVTYAYAKRSVHRNLYRIPLPQ